MLVTKSPFIGPLQKLTFGEEQINFTDSAKCLGVWVDRGLNWNKQIKVVTQKYNSKLCQLKRMGSFLRAKDLEEIEGQITSQNSVRDFCDFEIT